MSDVHASLSFLSASSNFTCRQPLTTTRSLLLSFRQQHQKLANLQALSTARQEPLQVELQQVRRPPQTLLRARAMDDEEMAAEERQLQELLDTRASAAGTYGHQRANPQSINVPTAPARPSSLIFPAQGSRPIVAEQQQPMAAPRATASSTLALPAVPRQHMQQPESGFIA